MVCLRCGRELPGEGAFCQDCLVDMERCPVKPGTPVLIPKRDPAAVVKRTAKRRPLSLEEQVRVLRRRCRILAALMILFLATTLALVYPAWKHFASPQLRPGQNYSSFTTPAATTTTTAAESTAAK